MHSRSRSTMKLKKRNLTRLKFHNTTHSHPSSQGQSQFVMIHLYSFDFRWLNQNQCTKKTQLFLQNILAQISIGSNIQLVKTTTNKFCTLKRLLIGELRLLYFSSEIPTVIYNRNVYSIQCQLTLRLTRLYI